ncbi:hypothetical protein BDA99DRAFT_536031 [Phascolomyces articulosus]|uniref:CST complex subunit Stn1 N-terminal domain-containing protein n=1 Tax=Phascolomyces articulosus TaxID=60185 RepID=A0AAD5KCG4_9FUNG|nr:hypothetical protein BDA99DRAFT_536031 [Phascolomyces articulosus]
MTTMYPLIRTNNHSIHGIVVQEQKQANRKYNGRSMWLDDSTGVIQVFLSPRLCCRPDISQLTLSSSVSVFGTVDWTKKGDIYILCGGFHVDHDPIREIYHWIRVMQANKLDIQKVVDNNKSSLPKSSSSSTAFNRTSLSNRFQSLMSQPSPPGSQQNLSPISKQHQENDNSNNGNFLDDFDSQAFTWSPDHPFASSTPISRLPPQVNNDNGDKNSLHEESPLRYPIQRTIITDEEEQGIYDDDDDEFGFDDDSALDNIDFSALEQKALVESRKRTFDDSLIDD